MPCTCTSREKQLKGGRQTYHGARSADGSTGYTAGPMAADRRGASAYVRGYGIPAYSRKKSLCHLSAYVGQPCMPCSHLNRPVRPCLVAATPHTSFFLYWSLACLSNFVLNSPAPHTSLLHIACFYTCTQSLPHTAAPLHCIHALPHSHH